MGILKSFFVPASCTNAADVVFPPFMESPFVPRVDRNTTNYTDDESSEDPEAAAEKTSRSPDSHTPALQTSDLTSTSPYSPSPGNATSPTSTMVERTSYFPPQSVDTVAPPSRDSTAPAGQKSTSAKVSCVTAERAMQTKLAKEKAPEWLAIFFDLAWTATFSNLTSNTELTNPSTLFAYIVFFVLAWWLWAAQVHYNVKYHRDDWYHRVMMLAQLFIFGAMAAFTKDFNPFSRSVNPKLSAPEDFPTDEYTRKTMLGISGLFACTRCLLLFSYIRVYVYARYFSTQEVREKHCKGLACYACSYLLSTVFFAAAYGVVKDDLSPLSFWIRLALWLCGIGAEVIAFLITDNVEDGLRNENTTGERLITLTTIILGEGLNSNAGALVLAASLIGFLPNAARTAVSITLIIGLSLALYVAGIKKSMHHSKITVLLHFPLHLALIVLLEALKNLLVLLSLLDTIRYLADRASTPKPGESPSDALSAAFGNLGIDLKQIEAPIAAGNLTQTDISELVNKALAQAYLKIFQNYELVDDNFLANFTGYIRADNGAARYDHPDLSWHDFSLAQPMNDVLNEQRNSALWIPISAGVFLFMLGIVLLVGETESRQRFVTSTAISRCLVGLTISLTAISMTHEATWTMLTRDGGLAHIVFGAFAFQYAVEIFFVWMTTRDKRLQSRSQSKKT